MTLPPPGPPPLPRGLTRGFLLSPELRRDLADLNAQYLALALTPALSADARFAWTEPVRRSLLEAEPDALARLAGVPLALFELALSRVAGAAAPGGVADQRGEDLPGALLARCDSLAHQAVYFARRLVDADALAASFVLELPVATRSWLADRLPSQLADLAGRPGLIQPRWPRHAHLWRTLIGASRRQSPTALQWACCIGVCLTGAGDCDPPPSPPPRRRARR